MDEFYAYVLANTWMAWTVAVVVVALTFLVINRESLAYWKMLWSYNGLFGKKRRLAKDEAFNEKTRWFTSEESICSDFDVFYKEIRADGKFFDTCKSYIAKAGETGRKTLPLWGALAIFFLMVIEGLGFSLILSDYLNPTGSANQQEYMSYGISLLIAIILVKITHMAGEQMYGNMLIKRIRHAYNHDNNENKEPLTHSNMIASIEDNDKDAHLPSWKQMLNRNNKLGSDRIKPSYSWMVIALILVMVIGAGAFQVRVLTMDKVIAQEQQMSAEDSAFEQGGGDPFAETESEALPAEIQALEQQRQADLKEKELNAQKEAGMMTYVVATFLYLGIQIIGIFIGYRYGFTGDFSKEAYDLTHRFSSRGQYEVYHRNRQTKVVRQADAYLKDLQSRMIKWQESNGIGGNGIKEVADNAHRTFLSYVQNKELESLKYERANSQAQAHHEQEMSNIKPLTEVKPAVKTVEASKDGVSEKLLMLELSEKYGMDVEQIKAAKQKADLVELDLETYLEVLAKKQA